MPIATPAADDAAVPSDSDLDTVDYGDLEDDYVVMTSPSQAYDDIDFAYLTSRAPDPVSHIPGASLIGQHWLSQSEEEDQAQGVGSTPRVRSTYTSATAPLEYEIGGLLKSCLADADDSFYDFEGEDGRIERQLSIRERWRQTPV